jgi:lysophospholipase L1-like esterase
MLMAKIGTTGFTDAQQAALYYARKRRRARMDAETVPVPISDPSFVLVGDSNLAFGFNDPSITLTAGNTITRDAAGLLNVAKTSHAIVGNPKVFLTGLADNSYEVLGDMIVVDANNFAVQSSVLGAAGSTTGGSVGRVLQMMRQNQRSIWPHIQSEAELGLEFKGVLAEEGNTAQAMADNVTKALALDPDVVILAAGTNNVWSASGESAATTFGHIQALADAVTAAGKKVIICAVAPIRSNYVNYNATKNTACIAVNALIEAYCDASPSNRAYADIHTPLYDTGISEAYDWTSVDGVHWRARAAKAVGEAIFAAFGAWFDIDTGMLPTSSSDTSVVRGHNKHNRRGPWATTSGGTVSGAVTGNVPSGWSVVETGSGACVCDIVAPVDGLGHWAEVVFTPAAANDAFTIYPFTNAGISLAALGVAQNDVVAFGCEVEISGGHAGNMQRFGLSVIQGSGGIAALALNLSSGGDTGALMFDSFSGQLLSEPIKLTTAGVFAPQIIVTASAAGSAITLRVRRCCVYKL